MKRALKWVGIGVASLLGILILVIAGLTIYAQASYKRTYENRPLYPIAADTSPEGLQRGEYLMEGVMDCTNACHTPEGGEPLSGHVEAIDEGPISVVFAVPNLTPDAETGLGDWSDAEIARAIREGVDKDGVGLVIMPSHNYHLLSDDDLAAIIGYLRGLEPVRNQIPPVEGNTFAKIMLALGAFGPGSVGEPISAPQNAPQPGTVEYGAYLVRLGACSDCHGQDLAGGPLPFGGPVTTIPANLTPAGELATWTEGEFIAAVVGGFKPDGTPLSEDMPRYQMNQEDLRAIFSYLKTIPAVQSEQ